jgi:hypothetical protein
MVPLIVESAAGAEKKTPPVGVGVGAGVDVGVGVGVGVGAGVGVGGWLRRAYAGF